MNQTIYFAGPLFNEAEKEFNQTLTHKLESMGFKVYLPQRDTAGELEIQQKKNSFSPEQRGTFIFEQDRDALMHADIFLFILDGRVPDEGACIELGIAYGQRFVDPSKKDKVLVGLQTDSRAAFIGSRLNPMVRVPLDFITDSCELLLTHLEKYTHQQPHTKKVFCDRPN